MSLLIEVKYYGMREFSAKDPDGHMLSFGEDILERGSVVNLLKLHLTFRKFSKIPLTFPGRFSIVRSFPVQSFFDNCIADKTAKKKCVEVVALVKRSKILRV